MFPCPKCKTPMQERDGKFGLFLFCSNQARCGQKTITSRTALTTGSQRILHHEHDNHVEPSRTALEGEMRRDPLYLEACALEGSVGGMAQMAYENAREHEYTRDRASVDASMVLWGGGMFCDMGMEDDDEDQRPW